MAPPAKARVAKAGNQVSVVNAVKRRAVEEWSNEAKYAANLRLLRALSVFTGAIFVFRSFGELHFQQKRHASAHIRTEAGICQRQHLLATKTCVNELRFASPLATTHYLQWKCVTPSLCLAMSMISGDGQTCRLSAVTPKPTHYCELLVSLLHLYTQRQPYLPDP